LFRLRSYPNDASILVDQISDFSVHQQTKCGIALRPHSEEVQEVPLRHHGDKFASRRQMREVGAYDLFIVELDLHPAQFLMRETQELIEHPQLMQQLQRGRMDGVTAKITEEIPVLFQDYHLNAGTGEEQPNHHSGGAATDNTTGGSDLLRIRLRWAHTR